MDIDLVDSASEEGLSHGEGLSQLDQWTAVVAMASSTVISRLESIVDFNCLPDLRAFVAEQFSEPAVREKQEIRDFLVDGNLLSRALLDERILEMEQARDLIGLVLRFYPLFDSTLLQQMLAGRIWPEEVPESEIVRAMLLLEDVPSVSRLGATLMKFAKHDQPSVRRHAARLIARHTGNEKWIVELYTSPDAKVRAQVIEGIGRRKDKQVYQHLVKQAAEDPAHPVSTMARAIMARDGHSLSAALIALRRRSAVAEIRDWAEYAQALIQSGAIAPGEKAPAIAAPAEDGAPVPVLAFSAADSLIALLRQ